MAIIHHRFFEDWNLHYVYTEKQCSLLALVEYGLELASSAGKKANLDLPALFDLRATELMNESSDELKKAVRLRKALKENTGQNPCAYVVGSAGSFGIMRMYGIFADLEGLRDEELTLITEDMAEAIDWLLGHLEISPDEVGSVRQLLKANF